MRVAFAARWHSLLFLGSDGISSVCLSALANHASVSKVEVVTPSLATPLADTAKKLKLDVACPAVAHAKMLDWDLFQDSAAFWTKRYDFMVVASFGHFIPEKLLRHFPATLNMHPSLLPKYRGASPIQFTILNEEKETGVSIIDLHPQTWDKGRVLLQEKLTDVDLQSVTYADLSVRLAQLGGQLLQKAIDQYGSLTPVAQDEALVCKAPKLSPEKGLLKCSEPAHRLLLTFRALFGTSIRPSFSFRGKLILPQKLRLATEAETAALSSRYPCAVAGSLWVLYPALGRVLKPKAPFLKQIDPILFIRTGEGWLALSEFVRAGKPLTKTTLTEFLSANLPVSKYQARCEAGPGQDVVFD